MEKPLENFVEANSLLCERSDVRRNYLKLNFYKFIDDSNKVTMQTLYDIGLLDEFQVSKQNHRSDYE